MNFLDALKLANGYKVARPANGRLREGLGFYTVGGVVLLYDRTNLGASFTPVPLKPHYPPTDVLFGEWVVVDRKDA